MTQPTQQQPMAAEQAAAKSITSTQRVLDAMRELLRGKLDERQMDLLGATESDPA